MNGEHIDGWSIEREIRRTSTWTRFLARKGKEVAEVTILDSDCSDNEVVRRAFDREIAQLRQLNHPHLVRFLEAGVHEGRPFYVLEHVPGPTLEAHLVARGPLSWEQLFPLIRQLASALKFAHDRGISQGDLSADAIVFVTSPEPNSPLPPAKITGFGPSAAVPPPPPERITPYTAPERREGKPAGPRGDLYGLGAIIVALTSGRPPAVEDPLSSLPVKMPGDFRVLLERMLENDPARRLPDGNTLCRQLDKVRATLEEPELTPEETRAATASLVSQFVREELEAQNQGGPIQRFFNNPWVVAPLFFLCLATLVWTFWPLTPEQMFRRGSELMRSEDPSDWSRAFSEYFDPLEATDPNHPYKLQLEEYRNRLARNDLERTAARAARWAGPMSEAQWAYQQGIRLRQIGKEEEARKVWQALVDTFSDVPTEGPWVRLAQQRLTDDDSEELQRKRILQPVREARARMEQYRREGKPEKADAIAAGLKLLYPDDPGVNPR
jgi:serine/threonine-protein kinase